MKIFTFLFDFLCSNSLISVAQKNSSVEKNTNASVNKRKQLLLMPLMGLVVLLSPIQSFATSGLFDAYAILNIKGAGNTYKQYSSFNTWNIGSFASGETLVLNGAQIKTYKNGGSNVTGGQIAYKIYRTGASASFSYINLPFGENYANPGDQRWENNSANVNVLSGLVPGNYTLEVYWQAYTSDGDSYYNNSVNNYKATFTVTGNYYSKSTGNLDVLTNWGTSTDGSGSNPPDFTTPGNTFNIRNNATPTIGASWTLSGAGSKIIVGNGTNACNFTVPSTFVVTSTATDVSNNGTITRTTSGANSWGTLSFASGAKYLHNASGGTIPTATWNANSTLQIEQSVTSDAAHFNQTFGNIVINGSSAFTFVPSTATFSTLSIAGSLTYNSSGLVYITNRTVTVTANITVDLNVTGAGTLTGASNTGALTLNVSGKYNQTNGTFVYAGNITNQTMTITGNLELSSGTFRIQESQGVTSNRSHKVVTNGNFILSGGTFNFSNESNTSVAASSVSALLEVKGNFTHSGGTISETASDVDVVTRITLTGTTGTQTLESTGQTGTVNFNVSGSNAQCVVSATKLFVLGSGGMTVANGSSTVDLLVDGTLSNASTITTTGAVTFSSTGTYEHNFNGTTTSGIIPISTWNSGSTCKIINFGSSSTFTGPLTSANGWGQTFSNFEWAITNQTGTINWQMNATTPPTINDNFIVSNSNAQILRLSSSGTYTLTIGGDLQLSSTAGSSTLNISNNGAATINIGGNFSQSQSANTQTLSATGTGTKTINFNKSTGIQTYTQSAGTISGSINWNVGTGTSTNTVQLASNVNLGTGTGTFTVLGNATLDAGTNVLSGSAASTFNSGATIITAHASGINGSITLSDTRTYNAATNYTFNGTAAQVSGAAVTAANNLILNNSAGLSLSAGTSVTGTVTLTNGKLTLGAFDLTLGSAASVSSATSTKYIVTNSTGQLKKSALTTVFSFPVGNSAYNPISISNSGTSDTYGIIVSDGAVANATVSDECVNRRWYITEGTSGGGNLTVSPQYNTGETGTAYSTESEVYVGLYVPTNWTKTAATVSGSNPFTASASGFNQSLTSNSYIAIGNDEIYLAAPTVTTTVAASSITNTTASSGGETITGSSITSKGVVWHTSTAPTVALSTKTNDGTGSADFTSSLTSLSSETFYYVRAYVTNAAGTGYGDEKTFRTLSNPATAQATSLSATATSSSNIDLTWNAATFPSSGATNKGYVLLRAASPNTPSLGNSNGAAPTAGANTTIVSSVIAENATSISSSGLAASTQYNYLLIPYTWDGSNATTYNYLTVSAPTASATTQSGSTPPVLTTNAASSVLSTTATLNGEITSDGGASVTARGFVYSTSDNTPTIGEGGVTDQASGSGTGTFNSGVTSLSPNTTYYYQAYATNTSGTSYGGVISFTTLKAEPSAQATSLVFSSITTSAFSTAFSAATGSPDGYLVIRSTSASLSANPVDGTTYTTGNSLGGGTVVSVGSTISGISNSSLSAGTTYYTFVFAYNNSGSNIDYRTTSPLSASTITLTDAPATPTFSSITTSGFTVDWIATSGASSYKLDVSLASNFASFVSGYQDLTVNTNSQAVTGLAANTLYYVRVRAVNASGTSANSTSANSATLPNAPTVGTASSITTSGLTANWTAPGSQGAVTFTYTVELSTANDFATISSTVSSIASGTITNVFSSLAEGTTYYYRIKAVNSAGNSAWSSVSVGATTLASSISLTALGTAVTENFDGMGTSGTAVTPSGIRVGTDFSTGSSATTLAYGNTGTGVVTSSSSGGAINWADGVTGSATDRALGFLTTNSYVSPRSIVAAFKNNTGATITNLQINWKYEKYRSGTRAIDWTFFHGSTSAPTSAATDGNQAYAADANNTTIFSPSSDISKSVLLTGLSIADGATYFIKWTYTGNGGSSNSQGLGIDDLSIKGCGDVAAPTASDQAFCSAASPTVASLTATGTSIQWYSASTGGTALSTSTALTTATTYYATQTDGGCESVSRTAVVVTINTNPSVPTGTATQIFCSTSSPTVNELSATGTSIQWYEASTGGSALATNTSLVNSTIYYATQTVSGCESTTRLAVTASVVSSGNWLGITDTDWNTASNWCGGIPTSSTNVVINSGASNFPNLSTGADGLANSVTINSGGSLTLGGTETLTITAGGSFTNSGTFTAGSSTSVAFSGTGSIVGTTTFNNISTSGALTPSATTTINGTLTLNSGGTIATNSPIFGASSTLQYNYGGGFGARRNQALEWPASNGPSNLSITNGSWIQLTGNRSLTGNVTITSGALQASGGLSLTMNGTTQTLTISTTSGGAIYGTDNGSGNDLSLVIANGSTTTLTGDATSSSDDEKKFFGITVNAGGTLSLSRGVLCKYGTFAVNGTLQINANGYIQTSAGVAPTYGSSATLKYNSGNSYGRGLEWSATSGAGYPINVQISNNTTLDLGANGGTGTARQCSGSLTVDSGSTITLNATPMSEALIVKGNYTNNGTTILSGTSGGDLKLEGDMNDNGVFTANGRAIFFEGSNTQTINSSNDPLDVDVVRIGKSGGEVILAQNLLVDETADPIQFTTAQSVLNLNGKTATFGKAGTASAITMNASSKIKGSSLSSLTILGSGNFGTLYFDQTTPGASNALNNLTITRSSGTFSIGNAVTIAGTLDAGSSSITGAGGITLPAAATLITSNASGVNGAIATSGSNSLSTAANYTFTGSTAQTTGTNLPATVNDFTITNTAGVTLPQSLTVSDAMSISGTGTSLTINPNAILTIAGTADFGGKSVTLKSDSSGTAAIGQVTGTLSNATNVTVERYIPAKRAWRLLTAPLKGSSSNTIGANWQGTANEGLLLFSPATYQTQTMTGYTTGGGSPNIWNYDNGWQKITNISTETMFNTNNSDTKAYLVFATGPHGSSTIANTTTPVATTLKPVGQLITGSVAHSLTANQFKLLPNPYASPLNTAALVTSNSGTTIWMVDPTLNTFGGYFAYDGTNWTPTTPSASDAYIQSGQGFFVKNAANTTFTIAESHKLSGNSNTWFERTTTDTSVDKIRVLLYKQINNTWQLADGILAVNSASGNHDLDATDVGKMSNFNENLLFKNGTSNLAIEYRGLPAAGTLQPLQLTGTSAQGYELRIHTENYSNSNLTPYLENTQTGALTAIPTDGTALVVPFTGIAATSAAPDSRFRIVYQGPLSADDMNSLVVGVYPNPVQEGLFTIELTNTNAPASYSLTNLLGQEVQKGTLMSLTNAIPVQDLSEGVYLLQINQEGKRFTTKLMIK